MADPLVPPPVGNPGSTSTWGNSTFDWESATGVKPFDWEAALDPNNQPDPDEVVKYLFPGANPSTTSPSSGPANNKKYSIKFNPPLFSYAAGKDPIALARNMDRNGGTFTSSINGNGNIKTDRKGWVIPDTSLVQAFDLSSEGVEDTSLSVPTPARQRGIRGRPVPSDKGNLLAGLSTVYGFRFLYNPATIKFDTSVSSDGLNLGYTFSGQSTSMPITSTGAGLGLSFPISRVDDLAVIKKSGDSYRLSNGASIEKNYFNGARQSFINGIERKSGVTEEDLKGIATLGTMYDLNFLFKAVVIREFNTKYRGRTADIGILVGNPLVLYLGANMVYRVRLTSISYLHRSFTPNMVPMYTEVSLGFERIPDVIGW